METEVLNKFKFSFLSYVVIRKINPPGFMYLLLEIMTELAASVFGWFMATCGWSLYYTCYIPLNITGTSDLISMPHT